MNKEIDPNIVIGIFIFLVFILLGGTQAFLIELPILFIIGIVFFLTRKNNTNPNLNFMNRNKGTL